MHFLTARETWTPSDLQRAQQKAHLSPFGERERIRSMIHEHEAEMVRCSEQIRLLRARLDERRSGDNERAARRRQT